MVKVQVALVFDDWREQGRSIYLSEKGIELSMGDFHYGTTFDGTIHLDEENAQQLEKALREGYQPVFWLSRFED